jgi:neogenin
VRTAHSSAAGVDASAAVMLNWQPPKFANGPIAEYLIYYAINPALEQSKWTLEPVSGDRLTTVVGKLKPDTAYYFKIQARNEKGYGPQSDVVQFKTPDKQTRELIVIVYIIIAPCDSIDTDRI